MPKDGVSFNEDMPKILVTRAAHVRKFLKSEMQNLKNAKEKVENFINQKKEDAFYRHPYDIGDHEKVNFLNLGHDFLKYIANAAVFFIKSFTSVIGATLDIVETASSSVRDMYDSISPIQGPLSLGVNLASTVDSGFDYGMQKISEGTEKVSSKISEFKKQQEDKKLNKLIEPVKNDLSESEINLLKTLMKGLDKDKQKQFVDLLELYHQRLQQDKTKRENNLNQELISTIKTHLETLNVVRGGGQQSTDEQSVQSKTKKNKSKGKRRRGQQDEAAEKPKEEQKTVRQLNSDVSGKANSIRTNRLLGFSHKKEEDIPRTPQKIVGNFEQLTRSLNETQRNNLRMFFRSMNRKLNPTIVRAPEPDRENLNLLRQLLIGSTINRSLRTEDMELEDE